MDFDHTEQKVDGWIRKDGYWDMLVSPALQRLGGVRPRQSKVGDLLFPLAAFLNRATSAPGAHVKWLR